MSSSTAEDRRYHARTVQILAAFTMAAGCLYWYMSSMLHESMLAAKEFFWLSRERIGPYALFVVASIVIGWAASWLAEQRGIIARWPVMLCSIGAAALGYLFSTMADPSLSEVWAFAYAFAAFGSFLVIHIRAKMLT
jgi:uncharacterized membrane protein YeaQ/YmgE (transglycosylase-associated protein family)